MEEARLRTQAALTNWRQELEVLSSLDPHAKNAFVLTTIEHNSMVAGGSHVSDKLLAQGFEDGRSFVKALCAAAHKEWMQELRPASD